MPNQPKTPLRSMRVEDDLWAAVRAKTRREGRTVTSVIVRALRSYVADNADAATTSADSMRAAR
jgi:hypothetical protein